MDTSAADIIKLRKQITYNGQSAPDTAMQVLHSLLPALSISGFANTRTSIFEQGCQAVVEFKKEKRQIWPFATKSKNLKLTLRVSQNTCAQSQYEIFQSLPILVKFFG